MAWLCCGAAAIAFFLNYADIRVLNQLLQIVIVFVLTCLIYYRKGAPWAALALTTYGLLLPIAISQSLQYSWVFYIGVVGSLVIIRFRSWLAEKQRVYFFFLFLGMLTCYMDLLTYPLFTWGIPMIWWIVTENDEETERHQLASVIMCGIAWICGYGGIWVGKWLIGGIILHQPLWKYAWGEVQYRAGIVPHSEGYMVAHLDVMLQNLNAYQNIQGISLLGGWIIWWLFQNTRRKQKVSTKKMLALLLIALSPIAWYVILHNHTYMHSSFTYRIWIVALTALLALMINSMSGKEIQKCSSGKLLVPIILMFIAVLIGLTLKEETHVHNGSFEPTQLKLTEQMELVQEFTPSFSTISALNLLLYTEMNQTGQIEVLLMEENQIIQKFIIDADMVEGGKFYELPANLQLKQNNSYRISISGKNLEGGHISVGLTDLGLFPLTELRQLQVDNQEYDAQIICGFRYRHRISLRKLALALELQLLVYWSLYLLWRKIIQGMRYKRSIYGKLKLIIKRKN